ncbi:MAG TPA: hypothetical protein PKH79_13125 [Prolixibacteraceae bacterium]|nr:hypothetical protein [Prolixibacteraceae bacterium]
MKEKIKELFLQLSRTEQLELLRELNSSIACENPVVQVNEFSQEMYGQNIKFEITNVGDQLTPNIKAVLSTPWGLFEAYGTNQRVAKSKAAEVALEAATGISENTFFKE